MASQQLVVMVCLFISALSKSTAGHNKSSIESPSRLISYDKIVDFLDHQLQLLSQALHKENGKEQDGLNHLLQDERIRLKEKLNDLSKDIRSSHQSGRLTGSTFTRWGSSACPAISERVYWGYAGGPLWTHTGSGSNLLCLPSDPVYDDFKRTTCGQSTVYGVEYHVCPDPKHYSDVVCAVCRSQHATTIMIPATNVCPPTWTMEYTGHVMAGYGDYKASSDYVCIDETMEERAGGGPMLDSQRLYYTISVCGSLPCPPYKNEKILTCVVCSK